ncbi:MAG: S1 family peptidase, partial [Rhizobiales bacterium]|nr:S1 family peptidase [Hyphomicrobiales bacterium]
VVTIIGAGGRVCTGTALSRDLVLTAAHCVAGGASPRVVGYRGSYIIAARGVRMHPGFDMKAFARARATPDVALIRLESTLPASVVPAALAADVQAPGVGQTVGIVGVGMVEAGRDAGIGIARSAALVVTGQPGGLQVRLVDPASRNARAGLGACTGDSGGPAFREDDGRLAVIGVVSWSTGANNAAGCGGLTGITPLVRYRAWIVETARGLGSPLSP